MGFFGWIQLGNGWFTTLCFIEKKHVWTVKLIVRDWKKLCSDVQLPVAQCATQLCDGQIWVSVVVSVLILVQQPRVGTFWQAHRSLISQQNFRSFHFEKCGPRCSPLLFCWWKRSAPQFFSRTKFFGKLMCRWWCQNRSKQLFHLGTKNGRFLMLGSHGSHNSHFGCLNCSDENSHKPAESPHKITRYI